MPFDHGEEGGEGHDNPEELARLVRVMVQMGLVAARASGICDNCFMKALGVASIAQFAGDATRHRPNEVDAEEFHRSVFEHVDVVIVPIMQEMVARAIEMAEEDRKEEEDADEHDGTH